MLAQQQNLQLSAYSDLYELIVPKDNLLRKINELIDFSFIYDELVSKYCSNNGRNAESPIRMFKYLLLKTIYDVSDVDVVERSHFDMSFKYFLQMTPEEDVINPSLLTKFRKLRLKDADLLNLLISKTVSIAIEKGIIRSKSIIVDATHSLSRSNPLSPIEVIGICLVGAIVFLPLTGFADSHVSARADKHSCILVVIKCIFLLPETLRNRRV